MSGQEEASDSEGIVERTQRLSFKEKARALNGASAKFDSKNPFFMVAMQPSYVSSRSRVVMVNSVKPIFRIVYGFVFLDFSFFILLE